MEVKCWQKVVDMAVSKSEYSALGKSEVVRLFSQFDDSVILQIDLFSENWNKLEATNVKIVVHGGRSDTNKEST